MLKEISKEMIYIFWLIVLCTWGLMFCDFYNRWASWEYEYKNWEYNLNPSEGSGWIDSIVFPAKTEV